MRDRLPLWQTAMIVLLGGIMAQIAGACASGIARAWLGSRGVPAQALDASPWVIVPAMVVSTGSLIAIAVLAPQMAGLPVRQTLGLRPAKASTFIAAAIGTTMLGPTADAVMRLMQTLVPDWSLGVVPMLHGLVREMPLYLAWPVFALLPGVSEELMFRGLLQNAVVSCRIGIVVSAVAFSLFHFDPHHVAGVLPLGFFLAWVASRCGTTVAIGAHITNNTFAIVAVHSVDFQNGQVTDAPLPWTWLPLSLIVVLFAARVIVRDTATPTPSAT